MATATCTNSECSAEGLAHTLYATLGEDESVVCGECGEPCEVTE